MLVKVKPTNGQKHLLKDTRSKGVINSDIDGYQKYMEKKRQRDVVNSRIDNLEEDVKSIKDDIKDILSILQNIAK